MPVTTGESCAACESNARLIHQSDLGWTPGSPEGEPQVGASSMKVESGETSQDRPAKSTGLSESLHIFSLRDERLTGMRYRVTCRLAELPHFLGPSVAELLAHRGPEERRPRNQISKLRERSIVDSAQIEFPAPCVLPIMVDQILVSTSQPTSPLVIVGVRRREFP